MSVLKGHAHRAQTLEQLGKQVRALDVATLKRLRRDLAGLHLYVATQCDLTPSEAAEFLHDWARRGADFATSRPAA